MIEINNIRRYTLKIFEWILRICIDEKYLLMVALLKPNIDSKIVL